MPRRTVLYLCSCFCFLLSSALLPFTLYRAAPPQTSSVCARPAILALPAVCARIAVGAQPGIRVRTRRPCETRRSRATRPSVRPYRPTEQLLLLFCFLFDPF